jgi:hypothetical protein
VTLVRVVSLLAKNARNTSKELPSDDGLLFLGSRMPWSFNTVTGFVVVVVVAVARDDGGFSSSCRLSCCDKLEEMLPTPLINNTSIFISFVLNNTDRDGRLISTNGAAGILKAIENARMQFLLLLVVVLLFHVLDGEKRSNKDVTDYRAEDTSREDSTVNLHTI